MLINKEDSVKVANSKNCTVWEYLFPSKELGFATAKIDGRYPDKGSVMNTACLQISQVISGEAVIHYDGKEFPIKSGDAFFFEKEKPYWLDCKKLELVEVNAPPWSHEQYRLLDQ